MNLKKLEKLQVSKIKQLSFIQSLVTHFVALVLDLHSSRKVNCTYISCKEKKVNKKYLYTIIGVPMYRCGLMS